ncbi:MAG: hypothetical protein MUF54_22795, partial [Polyangiaceae bacterium]|nr:hypothetical protein [Polyangiaceae bacterium]
MRRRPRQGEREFARGDVLARPRNDSGLPAVLPRVTPARSRRHAGLSGSAARIEARKPASGPLLAGIT